MDVENVTAVEAGSVPELLQSPGPADEEVKLSLPVVLAEPAVSSVLSDNESLVSTLLSLARPELLPEFQESSETSLLDEPSVNQEVVSGVLELTSLPPSECVLPASELSLRELSE